MVYRLPDLPYNYNALEPHIDEETMRIHHDKHHAGYVKKLNAALEGHPELSGKSVEELLVEIESVPEDIRQAVINNGGGHANHSLFWKIMAPASSGDAAKADRPQGELAGAINSQFSSFENFKNVFSEKASTLFGSGWVFLNVTGDGSLECKRHSFQNSPLMHGKTPVLGLDVWEHAYYLKYQNERAKYIEAWWNVVNWKAVEQNFKSATSN